MKSKALAILVATTCCSVSHISAELTRRWALNEANLDGGILESVSTSTSATLFGTTTGVAGNPGAVANDFSFLFNGSGNGVSTTLNSVLPTTGDFSVFVTAFFPADYQGGGRLLFSNNNGQAGRIDFGVDGTVATPNRLTFFIGGTPNMAIAFNDSTVTPVLFTGGWHEVGVTRTGTTFQLHVDGVAVGSPGTSSTAISTGTNFLIGRRAGFSGFWNNRISEVQVFNDARTQGVPILLAEPPVLTPYEEWAIENGINPFGTDGGPDDDFDKDGSLNLEEFETLTSVTISRDVNGAISGTTPFAGSSNPNAPDSQPDDDEDTLPDGWEFDNFRNLSEGPEDDFDLDTFTNWEELLAGSDPADELSVPGDTDGDGLSDAWEILHFGNLTQGPSGDFDNDGASNLAEFSGGSNPTDPASQPDGDDDGLPDGWENLHFGSLNQGPTDDFDGDGSDNAAELAAGSNPARVRSTPDNVNDTVQAAIATSTGVDEYSVQNNVWTFVRQITGGETTSLVFHEGSIFAASQGFIRRVNPTTGTAVTLVTRNEGDALTAGWTTAAARGMEIGPDGKLYFATAFGAANGQGVFRMNVDGSGFEVFIPRIGDGYELFNAIDLAWKDANTLFVTSRGPFDATNRSVYQFDAGGDYAATIANTLQGPQGLFVDGNRLWVTGTNGSTALIALDLTATPPLTPQVVRTGGPTNPEVVEILGELHVVAFAGNLRKDTFRPALTTVLASVGEGVTANDMVVFESSATPYDLWAAGFRIDPNAPNGGPAADFEGDGTPNGVEFKLGLNPTDGTSRFAITTTGSAATGLTLTWPGAEGIGFEVRSSSDLVDWSTLEATVVGQAEATTGTWTAPAATPGARKFYRVEFTP